MESKHHESGNTLQGRLSRSWQWLSTADTGGRGGSSSLHSGSPEGLTFDLKGMPTGLNRPPLREGLSPRPCAGQECGVLSLNVLMSWDRSRVRVSEAPGYKKKTGTEQTRCHPRMVRKRADWSWTRPTHTHSNLDTPPHPQQPVLGMSTWMWKNLI